MTDSLNASPLLSKLRRVLSAQEAVALMPAPMLDTSVGTMSDDPMPAAAIVGMQREISVLLAEATDTDLVKAHQETDGEAGELDAKALLAEIERRNLNI
ncbi:hypothetical protein NHF48_022845 [Sphingomonas sp. H160509]|jgi:hypothetical protein|uniref:hypothetical protein n=1 Tax=unclassified Sphingomonas TaxID=196159 RepID=UPI0006FD99AE|nr:MULTISPECIES: hypothetical protein [unclassified Sphingomonas]KQM53916.1 hypothetical protein ASE69_19120 [Sphingomonas sp. Leaf208]MDD1453112.1 hypothetical protein [Sphingomonas sp. H160509]